MLYAKKTRSKKETKLPSKISSLRFRQTQLLTLEQYLKKCKPWMIRYPLLHLMSDYYHRKFVEALIAKSRADTFEEALLEWRVTGVRIDFPTHCICTHPIVENCIVENVADGRELIIGSCCIRNFFPEEERAKMETKLKELKRKTRDCPVCNRRYNKEGALHDRMCNTCYQHNSVCEDCGEIFMCKPADRGWKRKCPEDYKRSTGKDVKGNHTAFDPRRKTQDCLGCGKRIPVNPNRPRCVKCYKAYAYGEE